jgi:phosphatidylinositol 4-kinase
MDLTTRAFLAVRRYHEHMYNLVRLMLNSGLKCFRKESMKHFLERF